MKGEVWADEVEVAGEATEPAPAEAGAEEETQHDQAEPGEDEEFAGVIHRVKLPRGDLGSNCGVKRRGPRLMKIVGLAFDGEGHVQTADVVGEDRDDSFQDL